MGDIIEHESMPIKVDEKLKSVDVRKAFEKLLDVLITQNSDKPDKDTLCAIEELQQRIISLEREGEALQGEHRTLYSLLDGIPGFVFLRAPDYSISFVNKYFREHFGDPVEKPCYEIMANRREPCEECRILDIFRTKKPQKWEWTSKINNGVYQIYDYPFIGMGDKFMVLEFGIDITDLKKREEQIQHISARELEKDSIMLKQSKHASMGEMIGNIAHEWRQPLTLISMLIQNLEESYRYGNFTREFLDETIHQVVDVIQYMSHTIDDFSNFFSPEKTKSLFSVRDSVNKALSFLKPELKRSKIRFEVDIPDDFLIIGYPNEYAHVLLNIIKNAMDVFLERKISDPKITITGFSEAGVGVLTITDNAGGISEDVIGKIFDPYFTTKSKESGIGIGLYMAKIIVETNMHGKLSVRNVGNGAEFRIEI
jgi:signal transduction histidine kinase